MAEQLKTGIAGFKQNIASNAMAAFSVSLVALPLALGLAVASGVPAISGIIAAVVGGVVCAILGNSKVAITGPGNGLIAVIATAVLALGGSNPMLGYQITLAAVVVSGILVAAFGFLKLGNLGEFFPSSAIQGMLAAIGMIIIAKQINVMLGVKVDAKAPLDLILAVPSSIKQICVSSTIPYAGILGTGSLLLLVGFSFIKNKYIKMIPAPMWVVVLSVGFSFFFENFKGGNPIPKELLIDLPDEIGGSIKFPIFEKMMTSDFISAVIGITLVATIESLLSIKAVEKLDPHKRRVNLNTDLKALGLGSIASGFLGGLPVVTVIARSSVNVNHGGKTSVANFLHATFLAVFILLGKDLLQKIPLAALAGILVYTGYKLASPATFKKAFKVGSEQLLIFIITFLATFLTGLVTGIAIGIVATALVQLFQSNPRDLIPRHLFRPNTLMYQEDNDTYYVGMKWFSNFMNYLKLKSLLDTIPAGGHIVLDFSLTRLVDHSVMEHVYHYSDDYVKKGGRFEVIGLDVHNPNSAHPYSGRRVINAAKKQIQKVLTGRQKGLTKYAEKIGWKFKAHSAFDLPDLFEFLFFSDKDVEYAYNLSIGEETELTYKLFDIEYSKGALIAKEVYRSTMLQLCFNNRELPKFVLNKQKLVKRSAFDSGSIRDILGNEEEVEETPIYETDFFNEDLKKFIDANPYYNIESIGKSILIVKQGRVASLSETKSLVEFGNHIVDILNK